MPCRIPNAPANGQLGVSGTNNRQTATYSCDTGYNLVGNSTRTCQAGGVWSGSEPTCQGVLFSMYHLSKEKFRCYKAKIEESEKTGSRRESNPGHLA